jgi:hypothetical protein
VALLPLIIFYIRKCIFIREIEGVLYEKGKRAYLPASIHSFTTFGSFSVAMPILNDCFFRSWIVALPSVSRNPSWQPFAPPQQRSSQKHSCKSSPCAQFLSPDPRYYLE